MLRSAERRSPLRYVRDPHQGMQFAQEGGDLFRIRGVSGAREACSTNQQSVEVVFLLPKLFAGPRRSFFIAARKKMGKSSSRLHSDRMGIERAQPHRMRK